MCDFPSTAMVDGHVSSTLTLREAHGPAPISVMACGGWAISLVGAAPVLRPLVSPPDGALRPGPAAAAAHLGGRSSQVKGRKENQEAETIFFPDGSLDLGP